MSVLKFLVLVDRAWRRGENGIPTTSTSLVARGITGSVTLMIYEIEVEVGKQAPGTVLVKSHDEMLLNAGWEKILVFAMSQKDPLILTLKSGDPVPSYWKESN